MNKNKVIFTIIWILVFTLIIIWIFSLKKNNNNTNTTNKKDIFNIWIVWDNKDDFVSFINDFKELQPEYKKSQINVESFSNSEEYNFALIWAIIKWKAPDLFVLNNGEKNSIFSEQIIWIDPNIINPNDFRKKYKWIFSEDLISEYIDEEWKEKEYLIWIPIWYETLWIFYNLRYVKSSDLENLSSLNNIVSSLKKSKPNLIPIWMWNGSTVENVADIIVQFLMLEDWANSLLELTNNNIKQALATYLFYWDENSDNNYNSRFAELKTLWNNNLDLFSAWETFMIIWYPRMINKIDETGYSTSFLRATPFPHFYSGWWKTLINYNYFVINKDTEKTDLAYDFLSFLTTDTWAENYLSKFMYYLPALLSLESDKLEEKIHKKYKIVLKNFFNNNYLLSSFDRWIKTIFDNEIVSILDNSSNYENEFESFKNNLICKTNKFIKLENLSKNCE